MAFLTSRLHVDYIINDIGPEPFIINYLCFSPKTDKSVDKDVEVGVLKTVEGNVLFLGKDDKSKSASRLLCGYSKLRKGRVETPRERRQATKLSYREKILSSLPMALALPRIGSPATRSHIFCLMFVRGNDLAHRQSAKHAHRLAPIHPQGICAARTHTYQDGIINGSPCAGKTSGKVSTTTGVVRG
jgi:hypothetical protein